MNLAHKKRLDTARGRTFLAQPGHLIQVLQLLFPKSELGAITETHQLQQLDGHTLNTHHLGQGICRVLIGEQYIRPIVLRSNPQGSGGRRSRQQREQRPGCYDARGHMTFGQATLTRKGLMVLEADWNNSVPTEEAPAPASDRRACT